MSPGNGPELLLVRADLAGQAERHQRPPVIAAGERDHARPAGRRAGDLDRVLDRLGAGGEEDRLLREVAGRQRVQPLRERDIGLVGDDLEARVGEALGLGVGRGHDLGMAVPGVEDRDAAGEVDVAPALDVPELGVLGPLGIDRSSVRDAARHGRHPALVQACVAGHGMMLLSSCAYAGPAQVAGSAMVM